MDIECSAGLAVRKLLVSLDLSLLTFSLTRPGDLVDCWIESENKNVTFSIGLALLALIALVGFAVYMVRRDPDASYTWNEARGLVHDSYEALRKKELGGLEEDVDDVPLGEFLVGSSNR